MNYEDYDRCAQILMGPTFPSLRGDNAEEKVTCLELFMVHGSMPEIPFLYQFLKHNNPIIRDKTAETIAAIFNKVFSKNDLYNCLKSIDIEKNDLVDFEATLQPNYYEKALAIATFNRNGRVREKAISELAKLGNPFAIEYLLYRLSDWVKAVRERAYAAVKHLLKQEYWLYWVKNLPVVEQLKEVKRVDLLEQYLLISSFIYQDSFDSRHAGILAVLDEKIRLIFLQNYFDFHEPNEFIADYILIDKNFLIRQEIFKHLNKLTLAYQKRQLSFLVNDQYSAIRLKALESLASFGDEFLKTIQLMASDNSATVRQTARFVLKPQDLDFATIYRQQIAENKFIIGSLYGLIEVGNKNDIGLFKELIVTKSSRVKLACLIAIDKFEKTATKHCALKFLNSGSSNLRRKAVELLAANYDDEVLVKARQIFENGTKAQKLTIINLWSKIGGWNVIVDILKAITDSDVEVQNRAWDLLQIWNKKATAMYTIAPPSVVAETLKLYDESNMAKLNLNSHREKIWKTLPFFLRG